MWQSLIPSRAVAQTLAQGQILALLNASSGIFTTFLVQRNGGVDLPAAQSATVYLGLLLIHLPWHFRRRRRQRETEVDAPWLVSPAWIYFLVASCDVAGNYLLVMAFQYTSIISVALLDSFTIPIVMVLSRVLLRVRYGSRQVMGVGLCLAGLAVLVVSDALGKVGGSNDDASGSGSDDKKVWGDALCLFGATCYAVSNVVQEKLVKGGDRVEFVAMLGLFGTLLSGVLTACVDADAIRTMHWDAVTGLLLFGFMAVLVLLYVLVSFFLTKSDATLYNLSLLTADVWSLIAGIIFFGEHPSWLYALSFVIVLSGAALYEVAAAQQRSSLYAPLGEPEEPSDAVTNLRRCGRHEGNIAGLERGATSHCSAPVAASSSPTQYATQ